MSDLDHQNSYASTAAEDSQAAFETAVEVLSGLREGYLSPASQQSQTSGEAGQTSLDYNPGRFTFPSSAHLVPKTEEELAYDRCKKLGVRASVATIREELGIPSTGMANDHTWNQLSKLVAQLGDEYHLKDSAEISITDLTNICKHIETSIPWRECTPKRPAAAFVPILLYRWKQNRIRRSEQRKGGSH
ncbi:hypothetical protein TWF506_009418 [Arthrobotrys conoides]|uniref:Uncharacterized protein n=1 Tax=Arthrobotrys conoides TaxID=74498 RepID=A0AAN8NKT3_9PEZI